ncbi:ubiquinol-cytochrome-c reductase complex assembly factor 6 [Eupeodes corollae]|uniref:ubiquinol-cytochrome-c reductase complex assembly factor 6 n=1 Tax=Eupeodes corollae TaxID=290404 RepID=UPI00249288FE|nr:ubiquinol-cytochrome-c reductase complex assembly factor 6 [Eupeodes corollae]
MPAGVSWGQYTKFFISAMISMMAGSQLVHIYYKPLQDIDVFIENEMKTVKQSKPSGSTT